LLRLPFVVHNLFRDPLRRTLKVCARRALHLFAFRARLGEDLFRLLTGALLGLRHQLPHLHVGVAAAVLDLSGSGALLNGDAALGVPPRGGRPRCQALFLRPARRVTFLSRPKILRRGKKRYFCGKSPDSAMPTPSPSDQRLFEGIRFGNEADFECFFRRYYPRLVNYAARFVAGHETARDLVQDSFARLWERRCELRELDLASLLFTMVRNACLNYLKHNGVVARHELEYTARMRGEERIYSYDFLSDAEQPCLYEELQREVQKAVDALPDRCREVFRMSRFEGLKNREIAARLGISETAVEKHLARAVGRLGEHLRRSCSFELSVAVLSCLLANYL